MWLDIISSYEYIQVSIKAINLVGRDAAIYCAELMNVYSHVVRKKMDELLDSEGFFTLDRSYITKRTALTIEEQLQIDVGLAKLEVLVEDANDPNRIRIDANRFCAMLVDDDISVIREYQKKAKLRQSDKSNAKKNSVAINLKAVLTETEPEVLEAFKMWIDAMLEAKKPLTRAAVEIYQRNLDNYTDNKDVKVKILEIATSLAYHEFAWARDQYEKNYRGNSTFIGAKQRKNTGIDPNSGF